FSLMVVISRHSASLSGTTIVGHQVITHLKCILQVQSHVRHRTLKQLRMRRGFVNGGGRAKR
ncbi:MAG: hypothetical protein KDA96_21040, partial [Planctomycetaceae bacterium]|nr:hypothetical protein [Planctomycetaceae bacterium]